MRDKYNCKVAIENTADAAETLNRLSQITLAGDESYDVVFMRGTNIASAITEGYLTDLSTVSHLDFDKPWWDANFRDTMTFAGKNYAAIGYTTTNHMNSVWVTCFNKKLVDDYKLEDPYKIVEDGKWTFEKMISVAKTVARDLNDDDTMGKEDQWGVHYTLDTVIGFLNSCGVKIAEKDSSGNVGLVLNSEKAVDRMLDMLPRLYNSEYSVDYLAKGYQTVCFTESRALFHFSATHTTTGLRNMEIDFGMLPYPKFSEEEEYASSTSGVFLSMTTIPASIKDTESIGYFLEAYAYEDYKRLKPAFYGVVLLNKVIRDEESAPMLDYIYDNIEYDVGNLLNIGNIVTSLNGTSKTQNTDVSSFLASTLPSVQAELDKFNSEMD